MKVGFGCVVYKAALEYLDDFFNSIKRQTYRDFTLLILNDDIKEEVLLEIIDKYSLKEKSVVVKSDCGKTPAQLRVDLIYLAKNKGFEMLVLGDCDDVFSANRIERYVETYYLNPKCDFFYNDIETIDKKKYFCISQDSVENYKDILEQNFLGMSNTGIAFDGIDDSFIRSLYEGNLDVFDWYLFSRMLLFGYYGIKVDDTYTYYRIHDNNLVGIQQNTIGDLKKEIGVKIRHYENLTKYNDDYAQLFEAYTNYTYDDTKEYDKKTDYWWSLVKMK